jgi:hypothetical protein
MDTKDVLLNGKEIEAIWADLDKKMLLETNYLWDKAIAKAQCLKLLNIFRDAGLLRCEYKIQIDKNRCYRKTCRRCQIEKLLKEDNNGY